MDLKVTVLGAGNVGTYFTVKLYDKGYTILQVFNRTKKHAQLLANRVSAEYISDFDQIDTSADLYIIAVSDDAISAMIQKLVPVDAIMLHVSGSTSIDVFKSVCKRYGVMYPLQTISKNNIDTLSNVPLFIEASDPESLQIISNVAHSISNRVEEINSRQRLALHISAVFVSNYVNYLYSIGYKILEQEGLSTDWLWPLIQQASEKIKKMHPKDAQTGPAKRRDLQILKKHIAYLSNNAEWAALYQLLADQIINENNDK